jgi:inhibitor of KinA sporulation pathway (predicted exonuclease)
MTVAKHGQVSLPGSVLNRITARMDYVVVDLEATCWEGSSVENMEIIEIGAVCLDGELLRPKSDFQQFVRPVTNPALTDFCKELTGIGQRQIDAATAFPASFEDFLQWTGQKDFRLCSWGAFDDELFGAELDRHDLIWPDRFRGHVNLKKLHAHAYSLSSELGLQQALQKHGLSFEGEPHRGIDDARNISKIAQMILVLDD